MFSIRGRKGQEQRYQRTHGLRILHAGDLGLVLTEDQVSATGAIDVLLIPVGGVFTIDPAEADRVIDQLQPKLVFPMHYRTDLLTGFPNKDKLATLDEYNTVLFRVRILEKTGKRP